MKKTSREDKEKMAVEKINLLLSLKYESGQLDSYNITNSEELQIHNMTDAELESAVERIEKEISNQIFYIKFEKIIKFILITIIGLGLVGVIILVIK